MGESFIEIVRSRPLSRVTSLRVGGPARVLARPTGPEGFRRLLMRLARRNRRWIVLGGGTNVLFPDVGFDGFVLHTVGLRGSSVEGERVRASAGERLAEVAWRATRRGLSGLEWACGIPGTIGGAVAMNAGAQDGDVAGILASVDLLLPDGTRETTPAAALRLGYRTSGLREDPTVGVVLGATFELVRGMPSECLERARAGIAERLRRQPLGASAGSVFANPPSGPTAGQLLDAAGCKGMQVGAAVVSARHANVIVNEGSDNAGDVIALIDRMRDRVLEASGIELHEEIVRFDRNPR